MYGVVLWSDRNRNCAVIWCEDHASLAYYKNDEATPPGSYHFGPGDLVEFEVHEKDDMRYAVSPNIVAEDHYPGLADALARAGQSSLARTETGLPGQERRGSHVVAFPAVFDRVGERVGDRVGPACTRPGSADRKFG